MYKLTLTLAEKKAIDWVGDRNWNGTALRELLWDEAVEWHCVGKLHKTQNCNSFIWQHMAENTFHIPEHIAWEIMSEYITEGEIIPHFAPELKAKIQTLLDSIV